MKNRVLDIVMPLLPKNDLSHWVGRLVHHPLPAPLGPKSVEWFAKFYNINLTEAELPMSAYRTIGELFTRKLRPGARPVSSEPVVHPADAKITEAGKIEKQTLIQAKGKTYTAGELLGDGDFAAGFEGGSYLTYYLCPTDYHRVHSPVAGEIIWSCQIPGAMWPVNSWSTDNIDGLFALNERIVVILQTPKGNVALVMVAATNVGNMSMSFDESIQTENRPAGRRPREKTYNPPIAIEKGQEIGIFHMGSTVVMLYEPGVLDPKTVSHLGAWRGKTVQMGGALSLTT